jgi:hypothetical protein
MLLEFCGQSLPLYDTGPLIIIRLFMTFGHSLLYIALGH